MMNLKVKGYDGVKYEPNSKKIYEIEYKNVVRFEVVNGCKLWELDEYDECDEYLVLTLADGRTATFRNSHVDLFRI